MSVYRTIGPLVCFVVAISDLVHNVETIFHLSYVLQQHLEIFSEL